jgi:hypothetical protein
MKLIKGNIWGEVGHAHAIFFTGNISVNKDGHLVMGKGFAKEVRDRCPGISKELGLKVKVKKEEKGIDRLGLVFSNFEEDGTGIHMFQVKHVWYEDAVMDLIKYSAKQLAGYAKSVAKKEDRKHIALNYPGIGNGNLKREDVQPVLEKILPDNVYAYIL